MTERTTVREEAVKAQPCDPDMEPLPTPIPSHRPIPGVLVHNAYRCPESDCLYTAWSPISVQEHR
jgi:hypothetical protein